MRRIVALVVLAGLLACVPAAGEAELPTLDVAIVLSSWTLMPEDMPFFAEAAAEVGVKIRWHVYSYTSWSEQKSMILSADNRPDVFINCLTLADVATYRDQLAPLDDLIEQYAPNIRKAYAEDEAMREFSTDADGSIYGLAQRRPYRPNTWRKWIINKTWLDRLGLDVPTTFEELKNVLTAFRDEDANGNGDPDDEIPLAFSGLLMQSYMMMGAYGNYADSIGLSCKDGQFVYLPTTEDWRGMVEFLHELYMEGLLYDESATMDYTSWQGVAADDENAYLGASVCWSANDMVGSKWEDEYIVIDQIAAEAGIEAVYSYQPYNDMTYGRHRAHISATCEDKALAIRFLDLFYREDYAVQANYGSFTIGSVRRADGTYGVLVPEGYADEEWQRLNSVVDNGVYYFSEELESRVTPTDSTLQLLKDERIVKKTVAPEDGNAYYLVKLSDEAIRESEILLRSLESISEDMIVVSTVNGLDDEDWQAFQDKLATAGVERLVEIYQQAYDSQRSHTKE